MSFFGFNNSGHNQAAPGFAQAHNPFAGLSHRNDEGEALEFDDTYDGLGDQLEETGDDLNDDTFGGDVAPTGQGSVGRDFDFFGQTSKVANVIEEEHMRFARQQPPSKVAQHVPVPAPQSYDYGYQQQQYARPVRTGYEQYKEEPPALDDLQVDLSLWGVAPKKQQQPAQAAAPSPAAARKILSVEEVEAQMRAQAKKTPQPAPQQASPMGPPPGLQHQYPQQQIFNNGYQYAHMQQPPQQAPQHFTPLQSQGPRPQETPREPVQPAQAHPVQILQRPQSKHAHAPSPSAPSPVNRQQPPAGQSPQGPHQAHPGQGVHPTQILQNPNRLSGEHGHPSPLAQPHHVATPTHPGHSAHQGHKQQQSFSQQQQQPPMPPPQVAMLSKEEQDAYLAQEAKRAKRNHKIFVMSKDNGIMTPQDKNFITRIQLQQLVQATGNPSEFGTDQSLVEDFYYQVHSQIQGGHRQHPNQPLNNFAQTYLFQTGSRQGGMRRHNRGGDNHMQRMEQQVQRAVEAAKNKPKNKQLVIEGSLGKISFSNAKTPKPLLNIKRTESSGEVQRPATGSRTQTAAGGLSRKEALRSIEAVYDTLMKLEDHERWRPLPPASEVEQPEEVQKSIEWDEQRSRLNAKLLEALKVGAPVGVYPVHPFITLLSFNKTKKVMQRVFRHLTHQQRLTVLTLIVYSLDSLDVVKGAQVNNTNDIRFKAAMREKVELFMVNVMSTLFNFIGELDLDLVSQLLEIVSDRNVGAIAKSKIGASLLTMILSRAEIIKHAGGGNELSWQKWNYQYTRFFDHLAPHLPYIFPGSVTSGEDVYVWQLLAAIGIGASPDQQQTLVLQVKDRVMDTVTLAKTLPVELSTQRLNNVNLFMHSIGLDVGLLA
jgi:DNA topoisomerase 2-associated protein PAT1